MSIQRQSLMTLLHALGVIAAGYVALLALMWWLQPGLVYFPEVPSRSVDYAPDHAGLRYETVAITASDGIRLHGWFVPGPRADSPVALFLHGNAGNIGHRIDTLAMLHAADAATLIIDYRGFGRSEGHPTERGTYRDAMAAWRWLVEERGHEPGRIVVMGRSLGSSVAAWLAARVEPAGLVLEAAFTSIVALGQYHYPWAPIRLLSRFRYNTEKQLGRVRCPVLLIHGRHDDIVPHDHAETLARSTDRVVELVTLDGGHNDAMLVSRQRYVERLREFIASVTSDRPR